VDAVIALAGTIRIAPGRRADAMPHLEAIVHASRSEPGCVSYAFAFDVLDDHLVRIFEVFRDAEALAAHRASPHMAAWRAVWNQTGIGDRDMAEYDISATRKI
jgi:quinol monooxygenase YgiN